MVSIVVSKSTCLGPNPGASVKINYGLVTELARRTCLRSKRPIGMWVQLPPGLLNGELPLIGKGAVLKTAVGNHLGVQVSHSPLNASVA